MLSAPLYSDIFVYIGKNLCYDTKGYKPKVYASLLAGERDFRIRNPYHMSKSSHFQEMSGL